MNLSNVKMNINFTALFGFILLSNSIFAQTAKEIAKNCLPSTVSLVLEDSFRQPIALGSGFIVDNGKIVTNLHVVEGAKSGYVFVNGNTTKHKIQGYISIDKQNDLVILSVPTIIGKSLPLAITNPEIGENIYAIGNPKGLSGTISQGIISGIRNIESRALLQITAPISPGSSGGPVVNNLGQVVGVAVGTLASGQNLNFAIPSSSIRSLISKPSETITPLNISKGSTAPVADKNEVDIREAISVRDWKYKTGKSSSNVEAHHNLVASISFRNQLPYTVKNIRVLYILFDRSRVPVDYFEETYFKGGPEDEEIKPFLAKTITFDIFDWEKHRSLRKEVGENLEVRILDFDIVDE